MPGSVPDNDARAAKGRPLLRPDPLHAALLHLSAILDQMLIAGADMGTAGIVEAIIQYVADTDPGLLCPEEQRELLRIADWPNKGLLASDLVFLLNDDDGRGERLWEVEGWLTRLVTDSSKGPIPLVTAPATRRQRDIDAAGLSAVKTGLMPILRWLMTQTGWNPRPYRTAIIRLAACRGHVDVLAWFDGLCTVTFTHADDVETVLETIEAGQLPALQWLVSRPGFDFAKFDLIQSVWRQPVCVAAQHGHLDILKWLATQPGISVTGHHNEAICRAAGNGHLEVLKWLAHQPGANFAAADNLPVRNAISNGHLEVVKWLVGQPGVNVAACGSEAVIWAAQNGHVQMLEWLAGWPDINFSVQDDFPLCMAVENGHVEVVKFLVNQSSKWSGVNFKCFVDLLFMRATRKGHLPVLQWLADRMEPEFRVIVGCLVTCAAEYNQLQILEWLASQPGVALWADKNAAMYAAAKNGNLQVLQWLAQWPGCFTTFNRSRLLGAAKDRGFSHILDWLEQQPLPSIRPEKIQKTL